MKDLALMMVLGASSVGLATPRSETRPLKPFSKLMVSDDIEVLVRDGEPSVVVEGEPARLEKLKLEVKGDTLHIESGHRGWRLGTADGPTVKVTGYRLRKAQVSGAAKLKLEAGTEKHLELESSGAAHVEVPAVAVETLSVDTSGAAKTVLAGNAESMTVETSGAAGLDAHALSLQRVKIDASGAASTKVKASAAASVDASGASKVSISGAPSVRAIKRSGAASVEFESTAL